MTLPLPSRNRKRPAVPSKILTRGMGKASRGGWGSGRMSPSPGPGGQPMPSPQPQGVAVPLPWDIRPPGAREINRDTNATGINAGTSPFVLPGATFTLPDDHVGIIRSVVLSVNNMVVTSQLSWGFFQNRSAVEGWSNLTIFPRAAGSVSVAYGPSETFIFLPEQTTLTVRVTVAAADALTYQAGVSFHGWSYPKALAERFARIYR